MFRDEVRQAAEPLALGASAHRREVHDLQRPRDLISQSVCGSPSWRADRHCGGHRGLGNGAAVPLDLRSSDAGRTTRAEYGLFGAPCRVSKIVSKNSVDPSGHEGHDEDNSE